MSSTSVAPVIDSTGRPGDEQTAQDDQTAQDEQTAHDDRTAQPDVDDPARSTLTRRRRRAARITVAALVVVVVLLGAGYAWLSLTSHVQAAGEPDCEAVAATASGTTQPTADQAQTGICATLTSATQAWAAHDADAYGDAFTAGATYTTFMGTHYAGREDIASSHRVLFDGPLEGTRLADSFLAIDLLSDDVAVVTTRGDTYEGGEPGNLTKVQTYTMVRASDGDWLIASFHNTQRNAVMERIQFLLEPDSRPSAES